MPMNAIVTKELKLQGTFRSHEEFGEAVDAITSGRINVLPIITQSFSLDQATEAFATAADRSRAVKVYLNFLT